MPSKQTSKLSRIEEQISQKKIGRTNAYTKIGNDKKQTTPTESQHKKNAATKDQITY